jgi:hypothetical protein
VPGKQPTQIEPVPYLCPALVQIAKILRSVSEPGDPRRLEALRLLREVQEGIHQLRHNASEHESEALRLRRSIE